MNIVAAPLRSFHHQAVFSLNKDLVYRGIKDRITPQVNFFLKWASMVLAGTGKEGKTKEMVKDREGKMVGMYVGR